jgi:hypothetical protein
MLFLCIHLVVSACPGRLFEFFMGFLHSFEKLCTHLKCGAFSSNAFFSCFNFKLQSLAQTTRIAYTITNAIQNQRTAFG